MLEMHECAFDMIDLEGTADTAFLLAGRQHEMLDDELALAVEKIAECALAERRVEDIGLVDPDPGQFAALRTQ